MPPKPPKFELPLLAELVSRGDGSFILRPKVPDRDLDTWIDVKRVAGLLGGNIKPQSIYALLGEFLVYRRPLKSKVEVSYKSVMALRQASNDPDFWENPLSQAAVRKVVKAEMDRLLETSLQRG